LSEQAAKFAPIETREIWSETLAKKARKISVVKAATSEIRARRRLKRTDVSAGRIGVEAERADQVERQQQQQVLKRHRQAAVEGRAHAQHASGQGRLSVAINSA
jgi:hypothetical protein